MTDMHMESKASKDLGELKYKTKRKSITGLNPERAFATSIDNTLVNIKSMLENIGGQPTK